MSHCTMRLVQTKLPCMSTRLHQFPTAASHAPITTPEKLPCISESSASGPSPSASMASIKRAARQKVRVILTISLRSLKVSLHNCSIFTNNQGWLCRIPKPRLDLKFPCISIPLRDEPGGTNELSIIRP